MKVLKYPIISLTIFFALGILVGYSYGFPSTILYACGLCSFIILLFTFLQAKKAFTLKSYFVTAAFLFSFIAGILAQSLHYAPNHKLHYSHFLNDSVPVIKGVISERIKPNDYQEKYYFDVVSVNQKPTSGRLLLIVPKSKDLKLLHPGNALIIAGKPKAIPAPLNPDQFDYAAYMQKQDIFHQLKLNHNYISAGTVKNFNYYIGLLRWKLMGSFSIHNYSPQVKETLNALLLGQRQDVDSTITDSYKDAGVLHILAISGLHFSVLFYILTQLFRPLTRSNRYGGLFQLIAVLSILWMFAFITGLSASVVRSVVMFSIISFGQYINRNSNVYNSLAISILILLMVRPAFLLDVGFQLSYLAVFSIVTLEPLYRKVRFSKYKALNYFGDTLLITLAAQIGVLPLSLYYFNQFPLLFLLANIIVIPLSNVVLVVGLTTLLLNFIWPGAAIMIGKILGTLVDLMNSFIAWTASFQNLVFKNIPFTLAFAVALSLIIITSIIWLYKKNFTRTIAVLSSVLIFQLIFMFTRYNNKTEGELIVFHNLKNTLITVKGDNSITIVSTDSLAKDDRAILSYNRANFNLPLGLTPLQNVLYFKGKKILVLDKDAFYSPKACPDVLILTQSPEINLERILHKLKPQQVVADGTNYKSSIKQWKATCLKINIPFHATAEKGYYAIK